MKCPGRFRQLFEERFPRKSIAKKQILLRQGEVSTHAFFVDTGCLRMWHNDDGKDVTVKFFVAGACHPSNYPYVP